MKSIKLKSILKYLVSLGISIGLLWYLFKGRHLNYQQLLDVKYGWVILSVILSWVSHWIRAYRWNLMLKPKGYHLTSFRTFIAVMVGYIANLVLPRMGEVSRCAVLKKLDNVTIATSIGSVVTERLIDFGCLMVLTLLALAVDYDGINNALVKIFAGKVSQASPNIILYGILAVAAFGGIGIFLWKRFAKRLLEFDWVKKIMEFLLELKDGLNSLKGIENKPAFWVSTLFLWVLYFAMSYVVVFAMPQTSHLSLKVGLSLLVMGGLGMSAPVQGGFGTYHFLVTALLVVYGLSEDDGLFFATLLHSSQTLSVIVVGSLSLFATMILSRNKNTQVKTSGQAKYSTENR